MRGASVSLVGLSKRYGEVSAVEQFSLEIKAGEFVTLLGPSGSGKTTTLMMVAGFEKPTAGEILIGGESVVNRPPYRRNIGVVFQNYALFPHMTVYDNVAYPLLMRKAGKQEIGRRVNAALELVRLGGLGGRYPRELSGGQQQRVALARAIVFDPPLLLMDEPLGALDKKLREELQLEIKRIHHEVRVTVIYVTHDQSEALTMSDRIAVMKSGGLEQFGSAEDLYDRPATRFVAAFVGEASLLDARVEAVKEDGLIVRLAEDSIHLQAKGGRYQTGDRVTIVLRPEKLQFVSPGASCVNELWATIKDVVYLGETKKYFLQTSGGAFFVLKDQRRSSSLVFHRGEQVCLSIDARDVIMVYR